MRSANPSLERALLFTFAMHGLGILSMAFCLLPGMPGGGTPEDAARIHYIASHPWIWRLGWLPWQLTALSDLLLAVALLRTQWIPRFPAALTLLATIAAVIPDQMGQISWITRGIQLLATQSHSVFVCPLSHSCSIVKNMMIGFPEHWRLHRTRYLIRLSLLRAL